MLGVGGEGEWRWEGMCQPVIYDFFPIERNSIVGIKIVNDKYLSQLSFKDGNCSQWQTYCQ